VLPTRTACKESPTFAWGDRVQSLIGYHADVNTTFLTQPRDHADLVRMLVEDILAKRAGAARDGFIVGVDGKGCSGKSRLTQAFVADLRQRGIECIVASIDDFCTPLEVRYGSDLPEGLQVYHKNFEEEAWIEGVIRPFAEEGELQFDRTLLDPRLNTYTNRVQLELGRDGILIAEGLHLRKTAYRDLFSYAILLHISDQVQLTRALVRDAEERGKTAEEVRFMYSRRYVPSFQHYLREDRPCESADAIIDYENPDRPVFLDGMEAAQADCTP